MLFFSKRRGTQSSGGKLKREGLKLVTKYALYVRQRYEVSALSLSISLAPLADIPIIVMSGEPL